MHSHLVITRLLALYTLILSVLATPIVEEHSTRGDRPDTATITAISFAGSGCPAGSVSIPFVTDLTVYFNSYIASAGPGIPITENRKNCNLIIRIDHSPGWKYTLYSTEYSGFVKLDEGVTATQKSDYWFDGEEKTTFRSDWVGPVGKNYKFTDEIKEKSTVWSSCASSASNLYISTQIRVNNSEKSSGSGLITTNSVTHKVTHVYRVRWSRC